MDETSYSLTELADAADVSTRTIRYYISEGLLPPPVGAGHASRYTSAHLSRLRQIAALKAQYLPLKEIRNRLGDPPLPSAMPPAERSPRSSARDYLRRLQGSPASPKPLLHEEDAGIAYSYPAPMAAPMMSPPEASEAVEEALPPDELAEDLAPPGPLWRRIPIGDSAELVIADDLFRRKREKVEWLIRWARKVIT
jgi:DNA-binding transcriptional MerR regulator